MEIFSARGGKLNEKDVHPFIKSIVKVFRLNRCVCEEIILLFSWSLISEEKTRCSFHKKTVL